MDTKLKKEMKEIMRELLDEMVQEQKSPAKLPTDTLGRKRRPVMKGGRFLFYCNKTDLDEFRKICWDKDKGASEVLREKVNQVLKDAGVEPKDKG